MGLPASGKSTAITSLNEFGPIIVMGDVIREEAKLQSKEPGVVANELRQQYGKDIIAVRCVEKIQKMSESVIFIDGIRSDEEVEKFREYWSLYVIAIVCPNEIRFTRIMSRARSDDTVDIEQIRERDKRELNFGLGNVIENADYTIQNITDIASLQKKVRNLVKGLL